MMARKREKEKQHKVMVHTKEIVKYIKEEVKEETDIDKPVHTETGLKKSAEPEIETLNNTMALAEILNNKRPLTCTGLYPHEDDSGIVISLSKQFDPSTLNQLENDFIRFENNNIEQWKSSELIGNQNQKNVQEAKLKNSFPLHEGFSRIKLSQQYKSKSRKTRMQVTGS